MVPALVDTIKSHGLVLVTDKSTERTPVIDPHQNPFPRLAEGIDGVLRANGVLRFNETIEM
jgi:CDK inhibitor PHO81